MKERRAPLSLFPSSPARNSYVLLSFTTTTATAAKTSALKSIRVFGSFSRFFNRLTECVLCVRLTSSFGCCGGLTSPVGMQLSLCMHGQVKKIYRLSIGTNQKKTAFVERWLLLEVGLYWLLTVNQILERREKGYIKAKVTNRFALFILWVPSAAKGIFRGLLNETRVIAVNLSPCSDTTLRSAV